MSVKRAIAIGAIASFALGAMFGAVITYIVFV